MFMWRGDIKIKIDTEIVRGRWRGRRRGREREEIKILKSKICRPKWNAGCLWKRYMEVYYTNKLSISDEFVDLPLSLETITNKGSNYLASKFSGAGRNLEFMNSHRSHSLLLQKGYYILASEVRKIKCQIVTCIHRNHALPTSNF